MNSKKRIADEDEDVSQKSNQEDELLLRIDPKEAADIDKEYENHKNRLSLQHSDTDAGDRRLSLKKDGFTNHFMNNRGETKEQHDRRKLKEQAKVYLITYIAYALIHFQREFWSLSKPYITAKHPDELPKAILSRFDTA